MAERWHHGYKTERGVSWFARVCAEGRLTRVPTFQGVLQLILLPRGLLGAVRRFWSGNPQSWTVSEVTFLELQPELLDISFTAREKGALRQECGHEASLGHSEAPEHHCGFHSDVRAAFIECLLHAGCFMNVCSFGPTACEAGAANTPA